MTEALKSRVGFLRIRFSLDRKRSQHDTLLASASGGNPDPVTGNGMYMFMGKYKGDQGL